MIFLVIAIFFSFSVKETTWSICLRGAVLLVALTEFFNIPEERSFPYLVGVLIYMGIIKYIRYGRVF